ncbi:MAG TPA: alpha-amylase family protein [Acidimicrobiia bacterium]
MHSDPEIVGRLTTEAVAVLGENEADAFLARVRRAWPDLRESLHAVYGAGHDADSLAGRLVLLALDAAAARPAPLRRLDRRREIDPEWFQRPEQVGYVAYADRFAATLGGVAERLDYLEELGVTYLHLMPLLRAREGANDGGYAVADYDEVAPPLGTMADLEALAAALHTRGMSLCVDVVVNHTAREHPWAQRAIAGDAVFGDFYRIFPDRTLPDRYEETLREVFPDFAPGNFTFSRELEAWVWTTFNEYQWDLNYDNPEVLTAMAVVMTRLANRGVDVLRLDAVPFIWKRIGTDCENQPEAHRILQVFRSVMSLAAPGVVFKAEAIVPPDQLVQYLGTHQLFRRECDLAYHNQLMVMLWSSLATRDIRLMTTSLARLQPPPPTAAWVTYVRCHDDIGWAVSDEDAAAAGLGGFAHRSFLNSYYSGEFVGSFARGARFQENPVTGDARISGSAASLCGIDLALQRGAAGAIEVGIRRLVLLYSVAYSYGGIPLLYMGDEIALRNDDSWRDAPARRDDNRWMHRPPMDWAAAARRRDPGTLEASVFSWMRRLAAARGSVGALHAGGTVTPLWTDDPAVFAYVRRHPRAGPFLALVNFADDPRTVDAAILDAGGVPEPRTVLSSDGDLEVSDGRIELSPLSFWWLV